MKGISGRIVLAVIILSCGMAMQIGSSAGSTARGHDFKGATAHRSGKVRAGWLPSPRLLQLQAKSSYLPRHEAPR